MLQLRVGISTLVKTSQQAIAFVADIEFFDALLRPRVLMQADHIKSKPDPFYLIVRDWCEAWINTDNISISCLV